MEDVFCDFSGIGPYPSMSVIIPTHNAAHRISQTLESVLAQDYPSLEVIIVDASSTDRTLEVVNHFMSKQVRVNTVADPHYPDMLNRGIAIAKGQYISFLRPGDFFISIHTLRYIANLALKNEFPDLVYCGCQKEFLPDMLKQSLLPTTLQSCWFQRRALIELGKFSTEFQSENLLDIFCRFFKDPKRRYVSTSRILVDDERRCSSNSSPVRYFCENLKLLSRYFGLWAAFCWVIRQEPLIFMRYLVRHFR